MNKISLIVFFAVASVFALDASAWQGPSLPPGDILSAPLNALGSPQSKVAGLILNTGNSANALLIPLGKVGIGTLTPGGLFEVFTSSAVAFTVLSNGNVGVGVANPASRFSVAGGLQLGNDASACVPTKAGSLKWASSALQVCNGSAWSNL